ncbi:MAG: CbiX/SirB N-terminal domain-containing protein [Lentisphaeraceae bacterium]|nr:CbiX/SirB N-terminal domain-containing protein [Lentisphaeraceae bacterium]
MNSEKGLILIAHGSRVAKAAEEMERLVGKVQQKLTDYKVKEAYMEIQSPGLLDSIESFIEEGIREIDVLPLFFFEGRHMRDDIPAQVKESQEKFTDCKIKLLPYIGSSDFFADALINSVLSL